MACGINLNFRSQLRSILDILAITAVNEICKLVDDRFAILNVEISRSRKENEGLKCRLHAMELQLARGCVQGAREQCGLQRDESPYVSQKRDREDASGRKENSVAQLADLQDQYTDTEEGRTETLLIKEERLEEDSEARGEMKVREKGK
ncbi:hypothetical protein MATL_G00221160 [Megalops atlanticus]|uniref:Uncharacterized protein n=1 Tax=Megalops atlanticus TaxID=7932 RepID=A0A9D3SYJ3_MEGAT|nr:hypothetical protein MATL_G00221160 [Megalops atlanticus]